MSFVCTVLLEPTKKRLIWFSAMHENTYSKGDECWQELREYGKKRSFPGDPSEPIHCKTIRLSDTMTCITCQNENNKIHKLWLMQNNLGLRGKRSPEVTKTPRKWIWPKINVKKIWRIPISVRRLRALMKEAYYVTCTRMSSTSTELRPLMLNGMYSQPVIKPARTVRFVPREKRSIILLRCFHPGKGSTLIIPECNSGLILMKL